MIRLREPRHRGHGDQRRQVAKVPRREFLLIDLYHLQDVAELVAHHARRQPTILAPCRGHRVVQLTDRQRDLSRSDRTRPRRSGRCDARGRNCWSSAHHGPAREPRALAPASAPASSLGDRRVCLIRGEDAVGRPLDRHHRLRGFSCIKGAAFFAASSRMVIGASVHRITTAKSRAGWRRAPFRCEPSERRPVNGSTPARSKVFRCRRARRCSWQPTRLALGR